MGFLDKIFGGKKEKKLVKLKLEEVNEFVGKQVGLNSTILEKEIPAKFAEIKHLIKETKQSLRELEKSEVSDKGNKRFKKAAKTAKKDASRKIESVLDRLQPPFTDNPEEIKKYADEGLVMLREKVSAASKSIVYASVALKKAMKETGRGIESLEKELESLQKIVKGNALVFGKSKVESLLREIESEKNEREKIENELIDAERDSKEKGKRREEKESQLREMEKSAAFTELSVLEEKKNSLKREKIGLREKLVNVLGGVSRPLKKLENLSARGGVVLTTKSNHALNHFIKEPLNLFSNDLKGEEFKQLLIELKSTLMADKIDLKEKEKARTVEEIDRLLNMDFFAEFFWKENEIDRNLTKLKEQEHGMNIKSEINALKNSVRETGHSESAAVRAVKELQGRESGQNDLIRERISSLEQLLNELSDSKIQIIESTKPDEQK